MKKTLFVTIILLLGIGFFGFRTLSDHSQAKANQMLGLYMFVDCVPESEYEVLGSVKSVVSLSGSQYTDVRDRLLKKVKNDYPMANGAIFHFNAGSTDYADAIRFKE